MRRITGVLAAGAVAAACVLGGCAEGGYSAAIEDNFIDGCTGASQKVGKPYCQCLYDRIKKNISYEDFKQLEDSIGTDKKAPPGSRREFNAAVKACRSKL